MEEVRGVFKILAVKLTGLRSLGRPRRRWEDNIRMDIKYGRTILEWTLNK